MRVCFSVIRASIIINLKISRFDPSAAGGISQCRGIACYCDSLVPVEAWRSVFALIEICYSAETSESLFIACHEARSHRRRKAASYCFILIRAVGNLASLYSMAASRSHGGIVLRHVRCLLGVRIGKSHHRAGMKHHSASAARCIKCASCVCSCAAAAIKCA